MSVKMNENIWLTKPELSKIWPIDWIWPMEPYHQAHGAACGSQTGPACGGHGWICQGQGYTLPAVSGAGP